MRIVRICSALATRISLGPEKKNAVQVWNV